MLGDIRINGIGIYLVVFAFLIALVLIAGCWMHLRNLMAEKKEHYKRNIAITSIVMACLITLVMTAMI